MDSVIRATITYFVLFLLFRISGKRTLGESTPFDLILLLIISETTQEVLVDGDYSFTNMLILVSTLILLNIGLSLVKRNFKKVEKIMDGQPVILMLDGKFNEKNMKYTRVQKEDIAESARLNHGIGDLSRVQHVILETNGKISIIPRDEYR